MNLAIDIGNTRIKLGIFDGDAFVQKEIWEALTLDGLQKLAYNQKIENIILSSVANVPVEAEEFIKANFRYFQLGVETALPIHISYATPETLGKDRIAGAAGAFHLYPKENCLIIDAGTCITMDALNSRGEYLGGNIAPGIEMRLKAMHHFTAKLPLVSREPENKGAQATASKDFSKSPIPYFLGDSTENSLRNGGVRGALWEVGSFIRLCRRHFRPLQVILTGGDADFFAKNLKTKIFAHQNLVLIGLNKILQYNV